MRLDGRRILVVGASQGIGQAITRLALPEKARVAAAARSPVDGEVRIRADVRQPQDCVRLVGAAADALGGLDAVVYAAAIAPLGLLADTDAAQ